jgi:hypothetical protein
MVENQGQPRPPFKLEGDQAKMVLLIGGLLGVVLLMVGVVLAVNWWPYITGGLEEWHKHGWNILLIELCVFGGLALMFGVLQLVRSEERASAGMRRLLYGYNAVLASLLLITVLAHVNVLSYIQFSVWPFKYLNALHGTYDWTQSTIYTLDPQSKELLQKLQKPVKVFVMLPQSSPRSEFIRREVRTLMDNCRAVTSKLDAEYLSPDLEQTRMVQVMTKYKVPEREGILVVYGPEGDEKFEFIRTSEIFKETTRAEGPENIQFTGESAFIKKLEFLQEGKKAVVYFTQDDGELDLNNEFDEQGVGQLKKRLERLNYEVKPLKLGIGEAKVPDDAATVVITRPTSQFTEAALKALRDYVKPSDPKKGKGKLIILFDVLKNADGSMGQTGLEKFVQELGVEVGNDRIVCAGTQDPLDVVVGAEARGTNPVVAMYRENHRPILMHDVRTVDAAHAPGASPDYQAEPILLAAPQFGIWKETNLNTDVIAEVEALTKPERFEDLQKKVSRTPLPVAVAVSEMGAPPDPSDPHGFMNRQQQPRMLVFGDATWVDNKHMGEAGQFDLFTSSLAWLRERPDIGKLEPKERKLFVLEAGDPNKVYWYMFLLPAVLVVVGIVGLGANIWIVRRR